MSIFEAEVVDSIGVVEGNLELLVIDTLDWKYENEHLEMLQDKINNYLTFLESKQYVEKYGDDFVKKIISIHFRYTLTANAIKFLNAVSNQLAPTEYTLHIHLTE